MKNPGKLRSGFTARSVAASLFAITATAVMVQLCGMVEGSLRWLGMGALPSPALWFLVAFLLLSVGCRALARRHLLTRAELLCIFFATMMAAPLTNAGFWRWMIATLQTIPRTGDFEHLDALNPNLWPHGRNLLAGILEDADSPILSTQGQVEWIQTEFASGSVRPVPTIHHWEAGAVSSVRCAVRVRRGDAEFGFIPGKTYMLSTLIRAEAMDPTARYFCRLYYDDSEVPVEVPFESGAETEPDFLQRDGFQRYGRNGLVFPHGIEQSVTVELGLAGIGKVAFDDLQLIDISALDDAFTGRRVVSQAIYDRLPEEERAGLFVKPDNLFSWRGLRFLFWEYPSAREWLAPVAAWGLYALIVLMGGFALMAIMRRQWVENERYPLPLMQIPRYILGGINGSEGAVPRIFRNPLMWLGYGFALLWCVLKIWALYSPNVPQTDVNILLKPYFDNPDFGRMWEQVTFSITATFLGLCLFMNLNVLISLVVGYFLFRAQYWFGEVNGLATDRNYPYYQQQIVVSYLAYALLTVLFLRRYLVSVLREAWRGQRRPDEVMSYRGAVGLLAASVAALIVWTFWMGFALAPMLLLFAILLATGFVAAKLRSESGVPGTALGFASLYLILPMIGGIVFFGPDGVVFVTMLAWIFARISIGLIPAMQLEFIELARRFQVYPRHVIYTTLLGISAGILIGGWAYILTCYAKGADSFPNTYDFSERRWDFQTYNAQLDRATKSMFDGRSLLENEEAGGSSFSAETWACVFAAGGTALVTFLRQIFSGFWFHPIGFILGPSQFMGALWGSLLVAALIRYTVLKLGGAVTVREKLFPFATGVFLAGVTAEGIYFLLSVSIHFAFPGSDFGITFLHLRF